MRLGGLCRGACFLTGESDIEELPDVYAKGFEGGNNQGGGHDDFKSEVQQPVACADAVPVAKLLDAAVDADRGDVSKQPEPGEQGFFSEIAHNGGEFTFGQASCRAQGEVEG